MVIVSVFIASISACLRFYFYLRKISMAGMACALLEDIAVKRLTKGVYQLYISPILIKDLDKMYTGLSPEIPENTEKLEQIPQPLERIKAIQPPKRQYFYFQSHQYTRVISERLISLKGACNFRDLGGYPNREGRYVKWGQIYRADKLSSLRRSDFRYLQNLQIRLICDFRGPEEVATHPNHFPDFFQPRHVQLPIYDPRRSLKDLLKTLRKASPKSFSGEAYMLEGYRTFSIDFAIHYKTLFETLLEEQPGSVLFHCTGGKDRTGMAAALILYALDVPLEIIYQDYLASNYYRFQENRKHIVLGMFYGISPQILIPILEVRKIYLDTALDTLKAHYGSLENFMKQALGVGTDEKEFLKEKYLYK